MEPFGDTTQTSQRMKALPGFIVRSERNWQISNRQNDSTYASLTLAVGDPDFHAEHLVIAPHPDQVERDVACKETALDRQDRFIAPGNEQLELPAPSIAANALSAIMLYLRRLMHRAHEWKVWGSRGCCPLVPQSTGTRASASRSRSRNGTRLL